MGNIGSQKVRLANLIVENMATLFMVLIPKGIQAIIEQPTNSKMYIHPAVNSMAQSLPDFYIISTWVGMFGHPMPKPTHLLTNMRTATRLARQMHLPEWRAMQPKDTGKVYTVKIGSWVCGGKDLHVSAEYTLEFCWEAFTAWGILYKRG